MISSFIKYSIMFFAFFVFLSIPLNKKPLFNHFHDITHPLTASILNKVEEKTLFALTGLKDFGKKLFSNATPTYSDSIKVKKSAVKRAPKKKITKEELLEVNNSVWDIEEEEEIAEKKSEPVVKEAKVKAKKIGKEHHTKEDKKQLQQLFKSKS